MSISEFRRASVDFATLNPPYDGKDLPEAECQVSVERHLERAKHAGIIRGQYT